MKKGLYKFILSLIVVVSAISVIAPFSIKAQYLDLGPFVGFNFYIEDYDNEYNISLSNGTGTLTIDGSNSSIVQGPITASNGVTYYSTGVSPSGSGLNLRGDITLNQSSYSTQVVRRVIHVDVILNDNYVGYFVPIVYYGQEEVFRSQYSVNGNIISFSFVDNNVSLTNIQPYVLQTGNYLLTKNNNDERWNFPIESYSFVSQLLNLYHDKLTGITNYDTYYLPQFNLKTNDIVYSAYLSPTQTQIYVLLTDFNISNQSSLERVFTLTNGQLTFIESLSRFQINGNNYRIIKFSGNNTSGSNTTCNLTLLQDRFILPIYSNLSTFKSLSTDFALQFGLNNELLENLNIIANGNQDSNFSVGNNDNNNQLLNDTNDEYETIERQFNNDMNDKLDDINMTSDLLSNQDFLNSASFVKTQFNRLLNNTILGSLITFFLLLGLASIFIGRNK